MAVGSHNTSSFITELASSSLIHFVIHVSIKMIKNLYDVRLAPVLVDCSASWFTELK